MKTRQTEDSFRLLLRSWLDSSEEARPAVAQEILRVFEEPLAIFVLDMSGFSSSVVRHGIIHFLAMIHQMQEIAEPIIAAQGGEIVKHVGDNVLAVFDDTDDAYRAGIEIVSAVAGEGADVPEDLQIRVAIGIGYGPTLFVPAVDVWGDQANQAFKLGEDTAAPGEILLTADAYRRLTEDRDDFERLDLTVSGLAIEAYSRRADDPDPPPH